MRCSPIIVALSRHKVSTSLIVIEIALCCAIVCNILFFISGRIERLTNQSGLDERSLVRVEMGDPSAGQSVSALTAADLASIRGVEGVTSVTVINQVPYIKSSWNSPISLRADQEQPTSGSVVYLADESFFKTLGLRVVAGRAFAQEEYIDWATLNDPAAEASLPGVMLTATLAAKIFPGERAVGRTIYTWGSRPVRIVGVIDRLMVPDYHSDLDHAQDAIVLPVKVPYNEGSYLIRTAEGERAKVLSGVSAALKRNDTRRAILGADVYTDLRNRYYAEDRAMAFLLSASGFFCLVITALGIVGLTSFWVAQRKRQIGIRRALGATRAHIIQYFRLENLLLVSAGSIIGTIAAYFLNQLLMNLYEAQRLPLGYVAATISVLLVLGQIAVWSPAEIASATDPSSVIRGV